MRFYVYLIGFIVSVVLAVVGGIGFRFLEVENERWHAENALRQLQELLASKPCLEMSELKWLGQIISDAKKGGIRILPNESSPLENITNWDLQSTIFLAFQVIGSVGYGNAPPLTTGGRIFCVFYGLFGLPLFIIGAYGIGDRLFHAVDRLRVRICEGLLKRKAPPRRANSALAVTFALFTLIGLIVFIFIPAGIFYSLENWTYGEALYSCFITILTIGFADFVPGEDSPAAYRTWYRLAVGVWIMISLLWFGGVFSAIRKLLKYEEIGKPFKLRNDEDDKDDDPKNRRIKNWKKHFDRQWHKLRGRRRAQQYYYNHPARPSAEALDSRQRMAELDVLPVYTCHRPLDAPAYDAIGNHLNRATPTTGTGIPNNCVSRVDVKSGR